MNGRLSHHLDIDYLQELLGYLKEATGFGVLLVDPEDPSEVGSGQRCIECPLCALVHSTEAGRESCGREFLRAGNEAKRWGEPYFYHCYLGLMEWAIPIVVENELVGILTCGQVLIQGKDDLFYESVLKQTRDFGLAERDVNLAIERVSVVSGRKVRAAAELLRLVAERLSKHVERAGEQDVATPVDLAREKGYGGHIRCHEAGAHGCENPEPHGSGGGPHPCGHGTSPRKSLTVARMYSW